MAKQSANADRLVALQQHEHCEQLLRELESIYLDPEHTKSEGSAVAMRYGAVSTYTTLLQLNKAAQSQGLNSSARASTMRGRVGVTFQGRRFEPHGRGILQLLAV